MMNFGFYEQFVKLPDEELLRIVHAPAPYQAEVVTAAKQILGEREIAEEIDLQNKEASGEDKPAPPERFTSASEGFLDGPAIPGQEAQGNKWVNALMGILALPYAWSLFVVIKTLASFFACTSCSFQRVILLQVGILLYIPLIIYLFYKRRRWGWILLFADNLSGLIVRSSESYVFFKFREVYHGNITSFLIGILVKLAFVLFLWRPPITNYFRISSQVKFRTVVVTSMLSILCKLTMAFLF